jgi:hypothetical protein
MPQSPRNVAGKGNSWGRIGPMLHRLDSLLREGLCEGSWMLWEINRHLPGAESAKSLVCGSIALLGNQLWEIVRLCRGSQEFQKIAGSLWEVQVSFAGAWSCYWFCKKSEIFGVAGQIRWDNKNIQTASSRYLTILIIIPNFLNDWQHISQ